MSHILLIALLAGQIPPPPAPLLPESNAQSSAESVPADPKAQREWLVAYLADQMECSASSMPRSTGKSRKR